MTNKQIGQRIKSLLSQNKQLRQKVKELEIKNDTLKTEKAIMYQNCAIYTSRYLEYQRRKEELLSYYLAKLTKVKRQRNYYNRMVKDLRQQIKSMEENKQ